MHSIWQSYPAWRELAPHAATFDCDTLNALRERIAPGLSARFAPQEVMGNRRRRTLARSGQKTVYEEEILAHGRIPTRPSHPHDLYNALIWFTFPRAKMALHRLAHGLRATSPVLEPGRRGPVRDRLTALDEGGLVVVVAQGEEAAARALVRPSTPEAKLAQLAGLRHEIFVFGHGLIEVTMADATKKITALTMVLGAPDTFFTKSHPERLDLVDEYLSAVVETEGATPERIGSLPAWLLP